jgi:hypothetical protein
MSSCIFLVEKLPIRRSFAYTRNNRRRINELRLVKTIEIETYKSYCNATPGGGSSGPPTLLLLHLCVLGCLCKRDEPNRTTTNGLTADWRHMGRGRMSLSWLIQEREIWCTHGTSCFRTSCFKTSGFKTFGFKTSETTGLKNVSFTKRQVFEMSGCKKTSS